MGERERRIWDEIGRIKKGGPEPAHEKQRSLGKKFVRERLKLLLDDGDLVEEFGLFARSWDPDFPADGVVTGYGRIDGRIVYIVANDYTVKAGSIGRYHGDKILYTQKMALRFQRPIVYLVDSSGARIDETAGYHVDRRGAGQIFYYHSIMSGVVPQIGVLYGSCFAGTAYTPVFCDILIMLRDAAMAIASPRIIEAVTGSKISAEELGGTELHATKSGSVHLVAESEEHALELVKKVISYLPDNSNEHPPRIEAKEPSRRPDEIDDLIPKDSNRAFDMRLLIEALVDEGSFLELKSKFAPELITGFARIDGYAVGIIANQPLVKGGAIHPESAEKGAEFVWMCDAFNIPLIYLVDTPGFMVGKQVEEAAILRKGKKFIFATSCATVPKICVVVRKAYGAGIYAMAGPAYDPDITLALPSAEIAVMGPEAAINAVFFHKIRSIDDPAEKANFIKTMMESYRSSYDIVKLAGEMVVDELIPPSALRRAVKHYLEAALTKKVSLPEKKHSSIL